MNIQLFISAKIKRQISFLLQLIFVFTLAISSGHYHLEQPVHTKTAYSLYSPGIHDHPDFCPICQFILQINAADIFADADFIQNLEFLIPFYEYNSFKFIVTQTKSIRAPPLS